MRRLLLASTIAAIPFAAHAHVIRTPTTVRIDILNNLGQLPFGGAVPIPQGDIPVMVELGGLVVTVVRNLDSTFGSLLSGSPSSDFPNIVSR
jgi:hypothetical protein